VELHPEDLVGSLLVIFWKKVMILANNKSKEIPGSPNSGTPFPHTTPIPPPIRIAEDGTELGAKET